MKTLHEIVQSNKNKGQVIVLVAISLIVIFALAALAIDVGIAYSIKAKLNAAVDGAALAAGRGVKQGASDAIRIANAQTAAGKFFNANYPTGYMRSTLSSGPTTTAVHNLDGSWTITVTARAIPPLFFARAVGWGNLNVRALAETSVRDLDMILILDCSGSLGPPWSPSTTFPRLQAAAKNFLDRFSDSAGGDRVGLIAFASGVPITSSEGFIPIDKTATRDSFGTSGNKKSFDKSNMKTRIDSLTVGGSTDSGEAIRRALVELDAIEPSIRSSLRVIVFFSDGAPNDVAGTFTNGFSSVSGDLYSDTNSGSSPANAMWSTTSRNTGLSNANSIVRFAQSMSYGYTNYPLNAYASLPFPAAFLPNTQTVSLQTSRRPLPIVSGGIPNQRCYVNKAARNMAENIANTARTPVSGYNPVAIYSLGLGGNLLTQEFTDSSCYNQTDSHEFGENILKRIANTADVDTHQSSPQPTGLYCFAQTDANLDACFQSIANQILRLSK